MLSGSTPITPAPALAAPHPGEGGGGPGLRVAERRFAPVWRSALVAVVLAAGAGAAASPVPRPVAARTAPGPPPAGLPAAGPAAARSPTAPVAARWRWPLAGAPGVVRRFDPPENPYGPGHRGVDLAGAPGTVIRAAGAGVVRFAGPVGGHGVVSVAHDDGRRTTYEPVRPAVRTGDRVEPGTVLGRLDAGHLGCPVDACLHWGLIVADRYADPLTLLAPGRVRLYPVTTWSVPSGP